MNNLILAYPVEPATESELSRQIWEIEDESQPRIPVPITPIKLSDLHGWTLIRAGKFVPVGVAPKDFKALFCLAPKTLARGSRRLNKAERKELNAAYDQLALQFTCKRRTTFVGSICNLFYRVGQKFGAVETEENAGGEDSIIGFCSKGVADLRKAVSSGKFTIQIALCSTTAYVQEWWEDCAKSDSSVRRTLDQLRAMGLIDWHSTFTPGVRGESRIYTMIDVEKLALLAQAFYKAACISEPQEADLSGEITVGFGGYVRAVYNGFFPDTAFGVEDKNIALLWKKREYEATLPGMGSCFADSLQAQYFDPLRRRLEELRGNWTEHLPELAEIGRLYDKYRAMLPWVDPGFELA